MTLQLTQKRFAERFLGSRGRARILRILAESGELNHSQICRRVGMNYSAVNDHLEKLKNLGMIKEKRYGNIRMFEINFDELTIRFKRHHGVDCKFLTQALDIHDGGSLEEKVTGRIPAKAR